MGATLYTFITVHTNQHILNAVILRPCCCRLPSLERKYFLSIYTPYFLTLSSYTPSTDAHTDSFTLNTHTSLPVCSNETALEVEKSCVVQRVRNMATFRIAAVMGTCSLSSNFRRAADNPWVLTRLPAYFLKRHINRDRPFFWPPP